MSIASTRSVSSPAAPAHAATVDVQGMFDRIAPRYDAANRAMSVGIDVMWRRQALRPLLEGLGERPTLLDLGAGTLDGASTIAARAPGARIAAADFAREMLRAGGKKLRQGDHGARIAPHIADGHHLPYGNQVFDGVFTAFCVRNIARLDVGLAELRRVIRPGGVLVVLEFFRPEKPRWFFDKIYNARVLPLVGWALTGDRAAYRYLPESIGRFDQRAEFEARLRAVGFAEVGGKDLFPAGMASMVVAR